MLRQCIAKKKGNLRVKTKYSITQFKCTPTVRGSHYKRWGFDVIFFSFVDTDR
jgi:hypothetical protein